MLKTWFRPIYDQHFDVSLFSGDAVYMYKPELPLGFSIVQSQISNIPKTEDVGDNPVKLGEFADTYQTFGGTIGFKYADIAFGMTTKYLSRSIDNDNAYGFGVDLGSRVVLTPQVALGTVYRNVISHMSWSTGTTEALEKKLGLGLTILDSLGALPVALNADYTVGISTVSNSWALGGELWLVPQLLAMRLGTNSQKDVTFGLGVRYQDFFSDIAVVFKDQDTLLDNFVLFSAGMSFTPYMNTEPFGPPAPL